MGPSGVASPMALLARDDTDHVRGMIFTRYPVHGTDIRLPKALVPLGHRFVGLGRIYKSAIDSGVNHHVFISYNDFITRLLNQAVSSVIAHMSHIQVSEKDHRLPTQRARPEGYPVVALVLRDSDGVRLGMDLPLSRPSEEMPVLRTWWEI